MRVKYKMFLAKRGEEEILWRRWALELRQLDVASELTEYNCIRVQCICVLGCGDV